MPTQTKINRYTELLVNSINALSQTENWQSYLETSARLYKFDFKDQAMIHAQRPNATACADYDLWRRTDIADRQVKRGSKGIALIDVNQKVRYVFDYADTEARSDKRLKLWQIDRENETAVVDMLKIRYGAEADDLVNAVFQAASQIAADYSNDYVNDLIDYTEGSFLESYDNYNVWAMFSQTLENSIAYGLLSRCGIDPAEYFSRDDFEHLYNFSTVETMAILGSSVSELSERVLRDVERTTRIFERTIQNERINENIDRNASERDRIRIRTERGHGDVSSDIGSTGDSHIREVRTAPSDIPQKQQANPVSNHVNQGDIEQPPTGSRQDGEQQIGTINAGTDEVEERDREPKSRETDGVGGADEQPQTVSGGNNLQGTDSHVKSEEPEQPERVQTMLGMATVVKDKEGTKDAHVVVEFDQIPRQNYNMFMLAFPQIADGTYRSMTFKNKDKKELDIYHSTTSAGTVHVEISYFGTERPGHRAFDPSFKLEVDFEKRTLKPISYHNDRTGEDVNVLSVPLELQGLTAAQKEKVYDDMALKLHELLFDVKYKGFELIETEVFQDDKGYPLPAEPKENLTEFLKESADREANAHAYVQNLNAQFTAESVKPEVGSISFTRLGDFYECYGDEAKIFSEVYGATLTSRQGEPMCGIPVHVLDKCIEKLKEVGYTVQINDKETELTADVGGFFTPETPANEQLSLFDKTIHEATVIEETPTISEIEDVPTSLEVEETTAADIDESEYVFKVGDIIELDTGIYEVYAVKSEFIYITDTTTDDLITMTEEELYENGFTVLQEAKAEVSRVAPDVEAVTPTNDVETITFVTEYDIDPNSLVGKYYTIGGREFVVDEVNTEWDTVSFRDVTFQNGTGFPIFRSENIDFLFNLERLDREREAEAIDTTGLAIDGVFVPPEIAEPEKPKAQNFRITDDSLGVGGAKTKYQNNIEAIKTLHKIEFDRHRRLREATPEEQEILSKYVGWGGLSQAFDENNLAWSSEYKELKELLSDFEYESAKKSTLNAHYTSPTVIKAIYEGLENLGFETGNVLEPSIGVGNFFGMLPESMNSSKLYGVELDDVSGRIAQFLYPNAKIKADTGYEDVDFPDNFFDVAVGNIPFGGHSVADKRYDKLNLKIHDYFFAKSLDKVRPGGVVAFVTSKGTLDKQDNKFRKYLAERADLLGAIRLPNTAFKANAGTEVTSDIIFLQKRESVAVEEPEWVKVGKTQDGLPLNKYFLDNPDMVLGTIIEGNKMYGNKENSDTTCIPIEGADLSEQLKKAIANIKGKIPDYEHSAEGELKDSILATDDVKNYSYTLVDGNLYYRENSRMNRVEFPKKTVERIKAMVELRESVRTLINMQMDEVSDSDIVGQQFKLNTLYDNFNKKHGLINSSANRNAFKDDNGYYLLCSLEVLNEQGELERKADMFTKRTIKQRKVITSVDTASEALAVSIGETARVDLNFMSQLSGLSQERIIEDLQGVIYKEPFSEKYVTADEFLSGNIREKLAQALRYQNSIENPAEYADSVEALQAAMPKPLEASEISVKLGATWIEPDTIKKFIVETLQPSYHVAKNFDVHYSRYTSDWNIEGKNSDPRNALANSTFGTGRKNAYAIIEDTLNQRDSRVYDRVTENGKEKSVLNQTETMLAQEKQEILKQAFKDWIFKEPKRREYYVTKYNELFNSTRPREYDGSHITFAGMNPEITMKQHQRNAVARALYGGNTLPAHCVGAGKTFEMVAIAMESKRLGLCDKSLFVVPNHITEQIGSDFQTLYPSANILVATKKDFETKNRRRLCAKIATGDYDAVIIGHSQLEKIPISQERQEKFIRNQIDEIVSGIEEISDSKGERYAVKQLEKTKANLEVKLERLSESPVRDNVVIFEELGVDRLFVDESHEFKNV